VRAPWTHPTDFWLTVRFDPTGISEVAMLAAVGDLTAATTMTAAGAAATAGASAGTGIFTAANAFYALSGLSTILGMAGQMSQENAYAGMGEAQRIAAERQAQQMEMNAGQERARAQRLAANERKRADIVGSRVQALSAASGAGALDPTILDLTTDIEGEGEYRALTQIYAGEERATGLEYGAAGRRYEGESAYVAGQTRKRQAYVGAVGTGLDGALTLLGRSRGKSMLSLYG
jgi:hypothetical protein